MMRDAMQEFRVVAFMGFGIYGFGVQGLVLRHVLLKAHKRLVFGCLCLVRFGLVHVRTCIQNRVGVWELFICIYLYICVYIYIYIRIYVHMYKHAQKVLALCTSRNSKCTGISVTGKP